MDYGLLLDQAAQETGLPRDYLEALMGIESAGNPGAVSPKGALGLMQLMPDTARSVGVTDPMDPAQNIMGGARYFKQQMDTFGDPLLAAAAYNAGPGAVRKYGGVPPYRETRDYVDKFSQRIGQAGMAPEASMYGEMGDPTADAMAMLPQVSRSAVDEGTVRSTMSVADKLLNGDVTGSLTSPRDRDANSTGSLAADMIPTWQTAAKILNPINLLQLPMRALRMVDYSLRTAAGAPTLTDAAEQALQYVNTGETISRDPTATARDAAQQELTTAKGLRSQVLSPAQKLVHIFTTDPFEGERRALTAAGGLRARWAAQSELDKVTRGRIERDQKFAEAPFEIAKKQADAQKATAEAPYAGPLARANLANLEALPEYRRQSLINQRQSFRDAQGYSPMDRYRMSRDTMSDLERAEANERARREREQKRATEAAKVAQSQQNVVIDDERAKLNDALKAKANNQPLEDIQLILSGTGYEAVDAPDPVWYNPNRTKIAIRRRADAPQPAVAAPAAPRPSSGLSGMSSSNVGASALDWTSADAFATSAARAGIPKETAREMWKDYAQHRAQQ